MLTLLFVSLLLVNTGYALQCINNCTVGDRFGRPYVIPDGQCQQRISSSKCSAEIDLRCSENTDCLTAYAQRRIPEMVARKYDAARVYREIAPIIENSSRNGSIQCFNLDNNVVKCSANEVCSFEYDTGKKKMKKRGCETKISPRVFLFDGDLGPALHVQCTRDFCNSETTVAQVKQILAENGLTDADGRRISAGLKNIASSLLIILTFIFVRISYF
ncbi:unnamed protein product [Adineta steineri]|uniref:Uncharacterized protein n=1 Tax=Adineta steineri TaxID=433720 RepID=A0A816A8H4_9BILA|nr:unnamed protein product [Adineta steineri]CAF1594358.1 unnamed protein product [Adineta steineri]